MARFPLSLYFSMRLDSDYPQGSKETHLQNALRPQANSIPFAVSQAAIPSAPQISHITSPNVPREKVSAEIASLDVMSTSILRGKRKKEKKPCWPGIYSFPSLEVHSVFLFSFGDYLPVLLD